MEKYLAQHPLERILKNFRGLYSCYFTTPCDTVFALPKDSETHLDPIRNLIENFTNYIRRAPLLPDNTSKLSLDSSSSATGLSLPHSTWLRSNLWRHLSYQMPRTLRCGNLSCGFSIRMSLF
ncbi:Bgt-50322 [Blumeria graminis f. sp. tritici]|uniref:Bgt-50322 n=1 Tax=Blumeria graminis f. sp. tritici TaxID=62690 RepID=A0A9X9MEH5_BLUGR|nr:Bgt-50322 [Blumeria graminis f. sp. tritici]